MDSMDMIKIKVSPSGNLNQPYNLKRLWSADRTEEFLPLAVEKGIAEGTQAGPLAGYPVVGIPCQSLRRLISFGGFVRGSL